MKCRKILLIICTKNHPAHGILAENFGSVIQSEGMSVSIVDISDNAAHHELFYEIRDCEADLIICFDLSGMELRTETNSLSLNLIPRRICHLLTQPCDFYGDVLREAMNFSMFFYALEEKEAEILAEKYPNIENSGWCYEMDQMLLSGKHDQHVLPNHILDFLKRLLGETQLLG